MDQAPSPLLGRSEPAHTPMCAPAVAPRATVQRGAAKACPPGHARRLCLACQGYTHSTAAHLRSSRVTLDRARVEGGHPTYVRPLNVDQVVRTAWSRQRRRPLAHVSRRIRTAQNPLRTVVLQKIPQSHMLTCPSTVTLRPKSTVFKLVSVRGSSFS